MELKKVNTAQYSNNPSRHQNPSIIKAYGNGLILTIVLAIVASQVVKLPFFSIMGVMILSILIGAAWKGLMGVQQSAELGITFSSKVLLKVGIVLMGFRLNFLQIFDSGLSIIYIDILVITFTLVFMTLIGRWLKVDKHLTTLIAVGTAVCGASAIVAVAPIIKGKKTYTAVAVACIAILGTLGALIYVFFQPILGISSQHYGVLVGATLHEVAHVVAAGSAGGAEAAETAILVKLGRVALLIPVALILGLIFNRQSPTTEDNKVKGKHLPIPWFIFGFLAVTILNSMITLPEIIIQALLDTSVFLMSMAMAGLGLSIRFKDFKKVGLRPIIVGVLGSLALALLGPVLLYLL